jgi:tRNA pseudouridine38-40 synthase
MPARRRLRATLGYRGTHYAGWGVQRSRPTVQSTVEAALEAALSHPVRVTAAGRTDAGVHADAQVISFDTTSSITPEGLHHLLQRHLPEDVWVRDVAQVAADFDARRSARRRWYRYALWRNAASPLAAWQGRCLLEPRPLDLAAMRSASRALIGRHDFASLVTRPAVRASTDRTVFAADWLELSPSLALFEICADAYLKQMVRTIVGSLLWVGLGRWQPDQFTAALDAADRRAAGPNAPAVGLTLHRIDY